MQITPAEVAETLAMVSKQNLDIRTITLGINLRGCVDADVNKLADKVYDRMTSAAEHLVPTAEQLEREFGIPIVNKRISVTPIAEICAAVTADDLSPIARAMDRAGAEVGVDFVGGFSALVHKGATKADHKLMNSIPRALAETERVCASVNVGSTRAGIINPVKLVITNYPEGQTEEMVSVNNPENEADGTHTITFSKNLWIERDDFMEDAPKKFFRMTPGKEVRLKNAYIVKCTGCTKDAEGNITEIQAEYDPISKSGMEGANRKVKGTLHWVSADHCKKAEVRVYDRLFNVENPSAEAADFRELLNPDSLQIISNCYIEEYAANKQPGEYLQFQRIGYFMADKDSTSGHPVFNKTVGLKDTWAKIKQ